MSLLKYKCINDPRRLQSVLLILRRWISKKKLQKNMPTKLALNHFDDFYKSVFSEKWPSVRLALLSKQKHVAVVNNFGETEKAEKLLQNQGAFDLRKFLEVQKSFTPEVSPDESKRNEDNTVDEVVTRQLFHEEEKESKLHPEGVKFKTKLDETDQNDESNHELEYVYKPEDARTSLDFDLNTAEIDETRLIMPNSGHDLNLKEFIPATILRGAEEFIPESEYYKYYQPKIQTPVKMEDEHEFNFPEELKVYTFDRGDLTDFPILCRNILHNYDYLTVDGGELLAALALDVQPNDTVLDLCSSSGNIAYCIFQTLRPKFLLCTKDKGDIRRLLNNYVLDLSQSRNDRLFVTSRSVQDLETDFLFDKVLVNVPSTEDRTSLFENEDNIFHVLRKRDRLTLPEQQCELLVEGLKLVRPGGTVLYTSATLSPIQNDGVINQALRAVWEENQQEFVIKNLSPALRHTTVFFKYGDYLNLKFGVLVVPFLPLNFGPRYICKLVKKGEADNSAET